MQACFPPGADAARDGQPGPRGAFRVATAPALPLLGAPEGVLPTLPHRRPVIGLLGGICAGKSYVAKRIAVLGPARVVSADALAHAALDVAAADGRLEDALGPGYVRDGRADRVALGKRVFVDPGLLRRLERLVHPAVEVAVRAAADDHRRGEGPPVLVLDAPLLVEVGLDRACDALWFVDCPQAVREARATARGMDAEQIAQRERFQASLEQKRARADLIIDNHTTPEDLDGLLRAALAAVGVSEGSAPATDRAH